ncbi:MAG: alanine dehydrogenase [Flavobacteriaceae bacterium]|nr:alanine dehydrogenase [Flavobacteriaceae bacterium]
MKIGIIKERKSPPDRRVVLSPEKCKELLQAFPDLEIVVESSDSRAFSDKSYADLGITVVTNVDDCDVLLGVKEVPLDALIPNKKYFFFSHTIKKQSYNRELLKGILKRGIELYDHEVITNKNGQRLVAFGRYAGIVGAYNGIRTYGLKFDLFALPKATTLNSQQELIAALTLIKDKLQRAKIVLTGTGRVGNGAKEMLKGMGMKEVSVEDYLNTVFSVPVYAQIDVMDYNRRKDGGASSKQDFYSNPTAYESDFMRFAKVTDLYIAGHFFGEGAPYIFTRDDAKSPDFNIKVVADISCDIDGPVASTIRPSIIAEPIYGYLPMSEQEVYFKNDDAIAVMAVDNLPCELPIDASEGFGTSFATHVIPAFFNNDIDGVLNRACMTKDGKLTERFSYLKDFVAGRE